MNEVSAAPPMIYRAPIPPLFRWIKIKSIIYIPSQVTKTTLRSMMDSCVFADWSARTSGLSS